MNFLLTNDDGIDAPGLQALFQAVQSLAEPIIVAPVSALSGCSHRVTTDGPIRIDKRADKRFAIDGTPADCVRVGLHRLAKDVDWVLSGINAGGNLGADVHHSGTVAAAREAVLHGKPGIALSQYRKKGQAYDWERAVSWVNRLVSEIMSHPWLPGTFWNINLPHIAPGDPDPEVVHCPLDLGPLPLSYREEGGLLHYNGDYHERHRQLGSDIDVCFRGMIAVTRMELR
jgi:5'-nucleotidase